MSRESIDLAYDEVIERIKRLTRQAEEAERLGREIVVRSQAAVDAAAHSMREADAAVARRDAAVAEESALRLRITTSASSGVPGTRTIVRYRSIPYIDDGSGLSYTNIQDVLDRMEQPRSRFKLRNRALR